MQDQCSKHIEYGFFKWFSSHQVIGKHFKFSLNLTFGWKFTCHKSITHANFLAEKITLLWKLLYKKYKSNTGTREIVIFNSLQYTSGQITLETDGIVNNFALIIIGIANGASRARGESLQL